MASVSTHGIELSFISSVGLCVDLSDWKVYCGKTADWIWMPFGTVSVVGQGMGVFDGGDDRRRGRALLGVNLR